MRITFLAVMIIGLLNLSANGRIELLKPISDGAMLQRGVKVSLQQQQPKSNLAIGVKSSRSASIFITESSNKKRQSRMLLQAPNANTKKPYNVLFIVADDLRPNLGCYGDAEVITPNIDKLASRSRLFTRAYCQQAVCNPSRASVLTGLRPDENGVTDLITHFREKVPEVITLPQAFKNAGYTSVGVGKIFHGSKSTQDSVSWSIPQSHNISVKNEEYSLHQNRSGGKAAAYEFSDVQGYKYPDEQIADEVIKLLTQFKKTGELFFLATGFKKPHLPFCAPKNYWDMYATASFKNSENSDRPKGAPEIAFHQWQELRGYTDIPGKGPIDVKKKQDLIRAYYACITFVDTQIGRILDELDRIGLRENTVIVLWGDHGYHLGEQDLWCKSTNFELDTRIPLIIAAPGVVRRPGKTNAIVEAIDVYPTLLDLCGINRKSKLSGVSLVPLLMNPLVSWKNIAYSQFCRPYKAITSKTATHMGYTVRNGHWRYTSWYNLSDGSVEKKELYNLSRSPVERENLAGIKKYESIERKLGHLLNNYRKKS